MKELSLPRTQALIQHVVSVRLLRTLLKRNRNAVINTYMYYVSIYKVRASVLLIIHFYSLQYVGQVRQLSTTLQGKCSYF